MIQLAMLNPPARAFQEKRHMAYYALPARRGRPHKKNFRRIKLKGRGTRWQVTRRDIKKYGVRGKAGRFISHARVMGYYKPRSRKRYAISAPSKRRVSRVARAASKLKLLRAARPISGAGLHEEAWVGTNPPRRRKNKKRRGGRKMRRNSPILMLANRPRRRRRKARGGRNPRGYVAVGHLRRRRHKVGKGRKLARRWLSLPRRRNPDGIVAQVKAVFTIDNAKLAGAGLGGLVATNTVTDQIGKLLGREYQFQGGEGVLASAVSTGIVTGGVSLIVKSPGILGAVAIGGLIATAIRAIRWLMPGQAEKLGVGHTGSSASRAMASSSTSASSGQNGLGMVQSVEQIAAGESRARGLGDFLELRGLGQIPSSAVEGMGDFLTVTSPSSDWGTGKDIVPGSGEQF